MNDIEVEDVDVQCGRGRGGRRRRMSNIISSNIFYCFMDVELQDVEDV